MSALTLPPVSDLSSSPEQSQVQTLDLLFEPSPSIHAVLLPVLRRQSYPSYPSLIDACHAELEKLSLSSSDPTAPSQQLLDILGSHPRLGAKKVDSAQSVEEQRNLQGEGEELARLNSEYEEKFPGLRFVVFVNGRGRGEIMGNMKSRMDRGDYAMEVQEALAVSSDNVLASPSCTETDSARPCEILQKTELASY